jgi:general secretion pathway protein G
MIELLVVMAVLGILAAAVMPLGETLVRAQRERELRQALVEIRHALDDYKRASDSGAISMTPDQSGYPPSLSVLVEGVLDARAARSGRTNYFLRRIPRDPFADPKLPSEQTWRLRSYASPPQRPEAGADVFDVHSSSDAVALDGTVYSQW